jgi:hypothetical protein
MMMTFHLAQAEMKWGKKEHHRPTRCLSDRCRKGKRGDILRDFVTKFSKNLTFYFPKISSFFSQVSHGPIV